MLSKGIQKLWKNVCAGIAQTSYHALKIPIFKFSVTLGPKIFWGPLLHLDFADKESKLCTGDAQAIYLAWEMKKKWKTVPLDWLIMAKGKGQIDQLDYWTVHKYPNIYIYTKEKVMHSLEILTKMKDQNFS